MHLRTEGMFTRKGFTLIELLIVVAIIAILAAIAVPNFLEAQVRSKVSRVKADQRTITTALESYYVDHNKYPPEGDLKTMTQIWFFPLLTTPIAYLSNNNAMLDPFLVNTAARNILQGPDAIFYSQKSMVYANYLQFGPFHGAQNGVRFNAWMLSSWGPDHNNDGFSHRCFNVVNEPWNIGRQRAAADGTYDPTNGTVSAGDVGKFGGEVPPIVGVITSFK